MNFLVAVGFIIVVAVTVAAYVALRQSQDFSDANEVVPGVPTTAPKEWAGGHSPEARMHRRLRDAVLAMQANASLDDPSMAEVRSSLEQHVLAIDDRLVAVAALPKAHRAERLDEVEDAVQAVEGAIAELVGLRGPAIDEIVRGIDDVKQRVALVESARRELESMSPSTDLDALRARLEAESNAAASEGDAVPGEPGGTGPSEPGETDGSDGQATT